jgi:SAM-dependent methyltransferase
VTITSTDRDWELWGKENPYYGVLTDPKFLNANLDDAALQEFFRTGEKHVENICRLIRARVHSDFAPRRVLDYGCGAGRLLIPFARRVPSVVGIDVSSSMLEEARKNCSRFAVAHVQLLHLDQLDSLPPGSFDLIHSFLVFQHIPVAHGEVLLQKLIALLADGAIGALQFTFSVPRGALLRRVTAWRNRSRLFNGLLNLLKGRPFSTAHMQMNNYSINRIFEILAQQSCSNLCVEFTGDATCRGALLLFEKRPALRAIA